MTSDLILTESSQPAGQPPPDSSHDASTGARNVEAPARSLYRQAFHETISRVGARLGVFWILLLLIGAIFAPFIASSFPYVARIDGVWRSPLLTHIEPTDVTLLVAFFAAVVLLWTRKLNLIQSAGVVVWLVTLTVPCTLWPAVVYDRWRPLADALTAPGKEARAFHAGTVILYVLCAIDLSLLTVVPIVARFPKRLFAVLLAAAAAIGIALVVLPVHPPSSVSYSQYRELAASGRMTSAWHAPVAYSPSDYQRDDANARLQPPSFRHWLGTEEIGADVFSRMIHAARIALSIGFIATGISVTIGISVGGLMGYFSGKVDMLGMRVIEIIEAIPTLLLLLTFCAFFGRNLYMMMAIIGLLSWTGDARFIRAEFLRLRNQDFVHAAVASGLPLRSIVFRHMLPNGITPVLVNMSFGVASAILAEATLSFLGLGLVEEPSWGGLLNQVRGANGFHWWIATFPGLAIFLTVFAYNLIGEALRDALDPKLKKRD